MTNPNCRVLIFSILRFISTKCCKTQKVTEPQMPQSPAHQLFRLHILRPDMRHTIVPLLGRHYVGHINNL